MSYAGDISPSDTYAALAANENAVLIDCRTAVEWQFVGTPDLSELDKSAKFIEFQKLPAGTLNPTFIEELEEKVPNRSTPVYFICRSGARSAAAADLATANGYELAYNVADGFEGPHDEQRHRGAEAGWKASQLPWRQS